MAVAAGGFKFERGVGNARSVELLLQQVFDLLHAIELVHHDMGREGIVGGGDGPNVQVVYAADAVGCGHDLFYGLRLYAFGSAVDDEPQRVGEQAPGGTENDNGDDEAHNGIDNVPASQIDEYAREDYANADERVGHHVQVGAFLVEVGLAAAQQEEDKR